MTFQWLPKFPVANAKLQFFGEVLVFLTRNIFSSTIQMYFFCLFRFLLKTRKTHRFFNRYDH